MVIKLNYVTQIETVFIKHIKTEDFFKDIKIDVVERFDTSIYEFNYPLQISKKNGKALGKMKYEFRGVITKKFIGSQSDMYLPLKGDSKFEKEANAKKKSIIKPEIKINDYKSCLKVSQNENEINFLAGSYNADELIKNHTKSF